MSLRVITFDCANTLVETSWDYADHAMDCLDRLGVATDPEWPIVYRRLLMRSWPEYREMNQTRPNEADAWWLEFTQIFLEHAGLSRDLAPSLMEASEDLLYRKDKVDFRVYDDIVETLTALRERGFRLGVISNWDYSLGKVLESRGLSEHFDVVTASLVLGVEKPDPLIFQHTLERLGAAPAEALHIGDNPLDDFHGARSAGLRALLVDRSQPRSTDVMLHDMRELLNRV